MKLECLDCGCMFKVNRKRKKALKKGLDVVIGCPKCDNKDTVNLRRFSILPFVEIVRNYIHSRYMNEESIMKRIFCEEKK